MDSLIKAFDYTIKLFEIRNKRKDRHYEQYVHVCYESAKLVRDDFIAIFKENENILQSQKCIRTAIDNINKQREVNLSKRDTLRTNLISVRDSELTEFEIGLKRLVLGHESHALVSNRMQLFSLARRMTYADEASYDMYINHALCLNDEAIKIVEKSWQLINVGYAKYKEEYLNR
ncbi:TPA: hypothetical protein RQK93_004392 [Vibrio vulnificus]|uniref:hypothetical protein n=1 Tax=Vibrio vulnificus TaxID=672 RepID=UPI0005F23AA9|nr:hypothetical protein [Vibrio vulnificus]EGQ8093409.1 hypothetical protein [Vibrio vulnificus]EHH0747158.1 hypothetical protein [Vibrio vulnificus]EHH2451525.1 hypothetical protein [Vibrio vulnificus]EIZ4670098.1 hypothetical protein [Vibrio vulnificus]ELA4932583.1 hypothetical protein [Vibrio vulnificus]